MRKHAANKVEGFYGLLDGEISIPKVKNLINGSMYIYPTTKVSVPPWTCDIILSDFVS